MIGSPIVLVSELIWIAFIVKRLPKDTHAFIRGEARRERAALVVLWIFTLAVSCHVGLFCWNLIKHSLS